MSSDRKKPEILHDNWEDWGRDHDLEASGFANSEQVEEWRKIVNSDTGQLVRIRVHTPGDGSATITGVFFDNKNGVTSLDLRQFPVAAIQSEFLERREAQKYMMRIYSSIDLHSKHFITYVGEDGRETRYIPPEQEKSDFDPTKKIDRIKRDNEFYALVAIQFMHFSRDSENPTQEIAEINEISIPTAQKWLWEARKRKFLAPGKPGRRTKKKEANDGE